MNALKSILVVLMVFSVVFGSLPQNEEVKAQSSIYIRADGNVEGTNNIQRQDDTYPFTGNVSGEIKVQRRNFVLDGAGFTLQGK